MYRVSQATQIAPNSQNCGQYLMKTTIKRENDEFLVLTLKHVSVLSSHANCPELPKLWPISLSNHHKTRNRRIFFHTSQTCIGSYEPCKSPWTRIIWAIAHENGHKT